MLKGLLFFIRFSWQEKKPYVILDAVKQLLVGQLLAIFINSWVVSHIELMLFNCRCALSSCFSRFMHEKLANTDYCNLEMPDYFETRDRANKFLYGDGHGFSYVLESAFSIVGKAFTLAGIIAIISTMNIFIVAIFLLMVLASTFVDAKAKQKSHGLSMDAVKVERGWNYFTRILEDVGYSKEIRMNNISRWLIDAEMGYAQKAIQFYKKRNRYFSLSSLFSSVSALVQNAISYAYVVFGVLAHSISIGEFTMYVSAVATFSGAVRDILSSLVDIKVYGLYYEALDRYIHIPETLRNNKKLPLPVKGGGDFVIAFRNVSFKYRGKRPTR